MLEQDALGLYMSYAQIHVAGASEKQRSNDCSVTRGQTKVIFAVSTTIPGCFTDEDTIILNNEVATGLGQISNHSFESQNPSIMAWNVNTKVIAYSRLVSWIHYEPDIWIVFLHIALVDGRSLYITEDHLIFTSNCNDSMHLRKASKVNVGDCLFVRREHSIAKTERPMDNGILCIDFGFNYIPDVQPVSSKKLKLQLSCSISLIWCNGPSLVSSFYNYTYTNHYSRNDEVMKGEF
uniref:Hint domain-containing protein n=1 Tax=Romanomermis culicivorax TaxID=13658 RepID=A0A915IT76_ROMCU